MHAARMVWWMMTRLVWMMMVMNAEGGAEMDAKDYSDGSTRRSTTSPALKMHETTACDTTRKKHVLPDVAGMSLRLRLSLSLRLRLVGALRASQIDAE